MNRKLMLGIIVTSLLFLVIGFLYEAPLLRRGIMLGILSMFFLVLLILPIMAIRIEEDKARIKSIVRIGFGLDVVVIMAMEYLSRFAINYFYHLLYVEILIVMIWIMVLSSKMTYMGSVLIYGASLIKFLPLLIRAFTLGNVAIFGFLAVVEGAVILLLLLSKAYWHELTNSRELYKALGDAYGQLEIYSKELQVLTEREARLAIARDLHDTLGHEMTGLIMQLEMSKRMKDQGMDNQEITEESLKSARTALKQIREIVDTLRSETEEPYKYTLDKLIEGYGNKTGKTFHIANTLAELPESRIYEVIYRVVQEAMTNMVKHSQSKDATVYLYEQGEGNRKALCCDIQEEGPTTLNNIQLETKRPINGITQSAIVPGNGLNGMKERVEAIGGSLTYGYETEDRCRFFIGIKIPYRYK